MWWSTLSLECGALSTAQSAASTVPQHSSAGAAGGAVGGRASLAMQARLECATQLRAAACAAELAQAHGCGDPSLLH